MVAPDIRLTSDDRRLLHLLSELISGEQISTNLPNDYRALSESECSELIDRLNELAASRQFFEGLNFVEMVARNRREDEASTREIYLSWRKRNGRSRALASTHWTEFKVRLGIQRSGYGPSVGGPIIQARPMPFSTFQKLEAELLKGLDLSSVTIKTISNLIASRQAAIEEIRRGDANDLPHLVRIPRQISDDLAKSKNSLDGVPPISITRAAGLATVIADVGVLFTTRDWGVAGTLSTIAGGLIMGTGE